MAQAAESHPRRRTAAAYIERRKGRYALRSASCPHSRRFCSNHASCACWRLVDSVPCGIDCSLTVVNVVRSGIPIDGPLAASLWCAPCVIWCAHRDEWGRPAAARSRVPCRAPRE